MGTLFLSQGCSIKTDEERLEMQKQQAYTAIINMYWVQHPDIKNKCFGVSYGVYTSGILTIDCSDVEHLLVNPKPSEEE